MQRLLANEGLLLFSKKYLARDCAASKHRIHSTHVCLVNATVECVRVSAGNTGSAAAAVTATGASAISQTLIIIVLSVVGGAVAITVTILIFTWACR